MENNYKLSFSELAFEKGKWEIKQSVLEISNIEKFLSFFTVFSNYDLSKLGFTTFNNSNIFLRKLSKNKVLKEEIELFLTEEKFLQLLKNDELINYVKNSEITEENFLKFLYELKKNHIKTSEKLLFLKNFLNSPNNELFDLYKKIYKKENIFETNILHNDIIEDKFRYILAIVRGKIQNLIFEKNGEIGEKMNKLILSLINDFMVEHQDEIVEVITNPNGELSKQWEEQGNSVKEHLGLTKEMNYENNRKK